MNFEKYKEIKSTLKYPAFLSDMIASHMCISVANVLTPYFILKKYTPNKITLFMILFGIFGSIFFSLPFIGAKILGYICFYMWFTMDVCDGATARYTKIFSKYGTEMDYMAHLICHPLMNLSLFITYISMDKYDPLILSVIFIVSISLELFARNITSFHYYIKDNIGSKASPKISLFRYFALQSLLYPNFILVFTPLIILDYLDIINTFYILISYSIFGLLVSMRFIYRQLMFFYKG